jgi:Tol biopolymer transport system component
LTVRWLARLQKKRGCSSSDAYETGKARQLAAGSLTYPRWSPDSKWIAADDRQRSDFDIVLLDISALNLENGFHDISPAKSSSSK